MSTTLQCPLARKLESDMASLTCNGFFGPLRLGSVVLAVDRWRSARRQVARPAGAGPWPAGYHNRRQQLLASKLKRKFLCRHSTETSTSTSTAAAAATATAMPLAMLFLLPVSFLFYSAKLCPEFDFHVAQSRQRLLRAIERGVGGGGQGISPCSFIDFFLRRRVRQRRREEETLHNLRQRAREREVSVAMSPTCNMGANCWPDTE